MVAIVVHVPVAVAVAHEVPEDLAQVAAVGHARRRGVLMGADLDVARQRYEEALAQAADGAAR